METSSTGGQLTQPQGSALGNPPQTLESALSAGLCRAVQSPSYVAWAIAAGAWLSAWNMGIRLTLQSSTTWDPEGFS